MEISFGYSSDAFVRNLEAARAEFNLDVGGILRKHGRLLAVELANRTQPFSVGGSEEARQKGNEAVKEDIKKIFVPAENLADAFDKSDSRLAKRVSWAIRAGKWNVVRACLKAARSGLAGIDMGNINRLDAIHKAARRNGRVSVSHPLAIVSKDRTDRFIARKQKNIGFGKSGFAVDARMLGGVRGIPGWVTRQKNVGQGEIVDRSRNRYLLSIELKNYARYLESVLTTTEHRAAHKAVFDRMAKELKIRLAKKKKL